jgi:hypothetical protein
MTSALTHAEFLEIVDKSPKKTIWDSLCSTYEGTTYEGNKQVREAKKNLLVQQYELFKPKQDVDIETMFVSFQTLVSGLQVLKLNSHDKKHLCDVLLSNNFRINIKQLSLILFIFIVIFVFGIGIIFR